MKRVMLRMTPSLNYSVFYTKQSPACYCYTAVASTFQLNNAAHESEFSLKPPYSIHFPPQNIDIAGLLLPWLFSLFVLLCDFGVLT